MLVTREIGNLIWFPYSTIIAVCQWLSIGLSNSFYCIKKIQNTFLLAAKVLFTLYAPQASYAGLLYSMIYLARCILSYDRLKITKFTIIRAGNRLLKLHKKKDLDV